MGLGVGAGVGVGVAVELGVAVRTLIVTHLRLPHRPCLYEKSLAG